MSLSNTFYQSSGNSGKGGRKIFRANGNGGHQGNKASKHNRTNAHLGSEGLWQHTQDLHESGPDEVPALRVEVDTSPHP